ncbi:hypothetical protein BaRGS_00022129 [Batillaria attramentaria]|uniref:Uncharacterized protein n=1 Tax=Batillaria attramentaria TaxID=370345 RepID=A0ABD0KHF6_9CAEN
MLSCANNLTLSFVQAGKLELQPRLVKVQVLGKSVCCSGRQLTPGTLSLSVSWTFNGVMLCHASVSRGTHQVRVKARLNYVSLPEARETANPKHHGRRRRSAFAGRGGWLDV